MDSIRLKTKKLQSKMYLTQTQAQTQRLRLIDSLDSQKRSTPIFGASKGKVENVDVSDIADLFPLTLISPTF